jgi:non-ribosomal peptide synthetase component F
MVTSSVSLDCVLGISILVRSAGPTYFFRIRPRHLPSCRPSEITIKEGVLIMQRPEVNEGQWIRVGSVDALVMFVGSDHIAVGYYQNRAKAIKEDAVWRGSSWEFRHAGPCGTYLHGSEEAMVKRGPPT